MEELKIEKLIAGGYSLARTREGKVALLDGGYPGEVVLASRSVGKNDFHLMKTERIVTPSNSRRERLCRSFPVCGGCDWQTLEYSQQLNWKREIIREQFSRVGKIKLDNFEIVPSPKEVNYRLKMEFVCYHGKKGLSLGLYRRNSKFPVSCQDCVLGLRDFEKTRAVIEDILRKTSLRPYNRTNGKGELKHLILRGNGSQVMAILVTKGERLPDEDHIVYNVKKRLSEVSTLVHLMNSSDRVVMRGVSRTLFGEGILEQELSAKRFEVPPVAFFQNNLEVTELIVEHIVNEMGQSVGNSLLDLYSGIGTFSITIGNQMKRVTSVEANPVSVKALRANANLNGMFGIDLVMSDVMDYLKSNERKFSTVILDPPRAGVGEGIKLLEKVKPSRIFYVSCDPATLARDVAKLMEAGFEISSIKAFDMFPQTWHVETVCLLERR
ncbi:MULTISPECIES: 23S rRNA (uracil(1939)-C(5))-methyltransferase RlmD [unclassified Mesotoga]|uniref:23S rRNA (uracil(1939)-C(5))-methyltransferase RlmD n=1 Tax=unclassified Mesotoga TaxID=1184398 RepID=UPI000DA69290|nr:MULTISPECIES: 23S rRNA (uracil(1939)-C(5))-methyltransferase RlmD [unclassified Mesotoga]PZC53041.1 RNA methyltransferase [Mesotoga sp. TolDC]